MSIEEPLPSNRGAPPEGAGSKLRSLTPSHNTALLLLLAAAILAAGAALAGLLTSRPPGDDSPEAGFARDMMVHHAQAVQMADIVRDKTQNDAIRTIATDIELSQQAQIGMMQGWMGEWNLPMSGSEPAMSWMGHPTDGLMPGMAAPDEIDLLSRVPPREADKLFLMLMVNHHQAALPMAQAILDRTNRPNVRQLAEGIKISQQLEIQMMKSMLASRVGDTAKVYLKPQNGSHTRGSATLSKTEGSGVRMELNVSGLPKPNTTYLAHIHPGTCATGEQDEGGAPHEEGHHHGEHGAASAQEIEWPLSQVQSDTQGNGKSTTKLNDTSMADLFTAGGLKHLNVHAAGSGDPPVLACSDLY
jgi:uncharacterized protein (DUF305 family)